MTNILLACGVIAGPIYILLALIQAFTRTGFDISQHAVSLLSSGDLGWIQTANFLIAGMLTLACAAGLRQALQSGKGSFWGPLLVGVYGAGLIGAGIFRADPAFGFPPGTPPGPPISVSTQGLLHFITGGSGFLALIAACFIFARRFSAQNQRGLARFSATTGALFLFAFFGIASGSNLPWVIAGFWLGVVLTWAWLSTIAARQLREIRAKNETFQGQEINHLLQK